MSEVILVASKRRDEPGRLLEEEVSDADGGLPLLQLCLSVQHQPLVFPVCKIACSWILSGWSIPMTDSYVLRGSSNNEFQHSLEELPFTENFELSSFWTLDMFKRFEQQSFTASTFATPTCVCLSDPPWSIKYSWQRLANVCGEKERILLELKVVAALYLVQLLYLDVPDRQ